MSNQNKTTLPGEIGKTLDANFLTLMVKLEYSSNLIFEPLYNQLAS